MTQESELQDRPKSQGRLGSHDYRDNESRWNAIVARDPTADGRFVYSVRTTGVYCRPTCPSRLAKRENVSFHASGLDAERAGFRPCKRCRPDADSLAERHARAVTRACALIVAAEHMPSLDALATAVGLSAFHFHRVFKAATGVTPRAYASQHRVDRVATTLRDAATVTDAVYEAGFKASSRFYETTNARFGMSPTAYRAKGNGARIRFAVGASSLGAVLVAATDKGICAITIGDDPAMLVRDLQDRFAKAEIVGADADFEAIVAQVVGLVETPERPLDLPLDVRGTAFQQRVWQALRAIPAGTTMTYAEVAARIGSPRAVRAVGSACRANPIAVAIPCHRVVRAGGGLSGYRWGIDRKDALLKREGVDG